MAVDFVCLLVFLLFIGYSSQCIRISLGEKAFASHSPIPVDGQDFPVTHLPGLGSLCTAEWMDYLRFYVLFNSISVISG